MEVGKETDEWTDRQTDGQACGWCGRQIGRQTYEWTDRQTYRWIGGDKQMGRQKEELAVRQTYRWIGGGQRVESRADGQVNSETD